jgi:FKBP12-rapamycin complex-associated protein
MCISYSSLTNYTYILCMILSGSSWGFGLIKSDKVDSGRSAASSASSEAIVLALKTLGAFNFSGVQLLPFIQQCVVLYLKDENRLIRKEAAIACCKLLLPISENPPLVRGVTSALICDITERLLAVVIAEPDTSIRQSVIDILDSRFDVYLAQSENLACLFTALNDEVRYLWIAYICH